MNEEVKQLVNNTLCYFPKSFVNSGNELIFEPKNNLYFRLDDIESELDFKCKLFAWLSRPISKGLSPYWSKKVLKSFNWLLGTSFTKEEMRLIYTYLGNGTNKSLCIEFVKSDYDLSLLIPENKRAASKS
ncbi:hypothetical protein ACS2BO_27345 [Bacillus cereus group sp. BceL305]|uniref:hypothetical protein n=1 Tax=unclassified Bacillus cereus group TaxID=2750818 RepID=UPI000279F56A|nr:hypothetical protein [Bacillus cereus group sp. LD121LC]EJR11158.1 hypothetical protein II9_04858 [Bacillus cereus MSX-D12]KMP64409.1 hypothetical protein TU61_23455 [Bacillus cereus]KMP65566.1 hypothetical protein TU61_19550 [Bacillus cereus]MDA1747712.1 hypothetical protein [Bacillus cereus group sp. LD121LC]